MATSLSSGVTVVLGGQWGDEGKGKLVDILAQQADIVARCQGGNNAGHTVKIGSQSYDFHLLPSGIINANCKSVIGNGMVVHLPGLFEEIEKNEAKGLSGWQDRLVVSSRAHIVLDVHQEVDGLIEAEKAKRQSSIGTTKKGIGPTYSAKSSRIGLRICDLFLDDDTLRDKVHTMFDEYKRRFPQMVQDEDSEVKKLQEYRERLKPMVTDTVLFMNKAIKENKKIVVEGANAAMLDIDFGTYPYVTSSNCTAGCVCTGLGIPPRNVNTVYGVFKAYTTRVGAGAFPTELNNELGEKIREIGHEYGVTTGRPRRCGWFDVVVAKYSAMINGFDSICLTKMDILDTFDEIKIGVCYKLDGKVLDSMPATQALLEKVEVEYVSMPGWKTSLAHMKSLEKLPPNARAYVSRLSELTGMKVQWIGTGPARDDTIRVF
ncbi:adenylosuccinate synthetase isozyme 1-like [Halichondria panicea]|uniref:adenylosuccinate synthetase isozyme 1-like n=1 Tax=Halichondria panicea TaxID=6063 RepID=UPI00312BC980